MLLLPPVALSCTGTIEEASNRHRDDPATTAPPDEPGINAPTEVGGLPGPALAAQSRLRRLTVDEYNNTLLQLLGDRPNAGQSLPNDPRVLFDNDVSSQGVSSALITGAELLAGDVATRLLADKSRRDRIVGCTPAGPMDTACLRQFVTRFGRLAWRHTLGADDVAALMSLQKYAQRDNDFYSAVDAVVRAVLQDPEFLYRVEGGAPVPGSPGLFKLTGPEMATRLSYLLWGFGPDDALITLAEGGGLDTPDGVRNAAGKMLDDPAAVVRISRFHAMWMGYEYLPSSMLARAMKNETDHLMSRVIFEKRLPWQELLRSKDSWVTHDLAQHYGMTIPPTLKAGSAAAAWVPYAGTRRQGLLSQASFLSLARADDEKLMTIRRGKVIRELLLCQDLPPKPGNVKNDANRPQSPCKLDFLASHRQPGACAACHARMDPVGLGLDGYDELGAFRASQRWKFTDASNTKTTVAADSDAAGVDCPISGDGDLDGEKFNGPAGLANLMLRSPDLNACAARQLYRFAMGRTEIDAVDQKFLDVMARRLGTADFRFHELLLDFVSSEAFATSRQTEN